MMIPENRTGHSRLRRFTVPLAMGVLIAASFAASHHALAQTQPAVLPPADDGSIYTIRIENDVTGTTDEYYTSGVQLGWTGPTGEVPDFLANFGHALLGSGNQRVSIDLSQQMYTPSNTQLNPPDPNDRPYAATLMLTGQLIQDTDTSRTRLGMQVGVLGPDAGGEIVQNGFHAIIGDTQNRIAAMALVHEKLYQSTDLARIDFSEYLRELTGHLVGTFNFPTQGIGFALEAVDMFLGIDTAIPCGLIVNELISNAYKHGFPEGGPGTLTVTLKRGDDDFLHLTVADTGRGIRQGLNLRQTDSLGMQLVFTLVRQLHGTIDVKSAPGAGTTFELSLQEVSVRENEYALP